VTPEEGRICLEWLEPTRDLLGRPDVKVGGYFVYRRALDDPDYGDPVNAKPATGPGYVDTAAPYGGPLVYTVRATLPDKPKIEGPPSEEAAVDYRDVFPPPAPPRLDALPEASLVRLVWDPVGAPDLAGYAVFRREGNGAPARLNAELVVDAFYNDTTAQPGHKYVYTVRAVDRAGNQSAPSPEAAAEPL
jgi:fibronectin type 3 domain-containing protein